MRFEKMGTSMVSLVLVLCLLLLAGCASTPSTITVKSEAELKEMEMRSREAALVFHQGRYKEAEKILKELSRENTVSRSLYLAELGAVYIAQGRDLEARKTLMQAQAQVEILFDTESEEEAASLFGGELKKIYKGDPYERSSLYAILALLFLNEGDVDNALASCKSGLLHDADSSENYNSDYGMLQFIAAICHRLRGNSEDADRMTDAAFKAHDNQAKSPPGAMKALTGDFNALLVFWVGFGPTQSAEGEYKEKRMIRSGTSSSDSFAVVFEDTYIDSYKGLGDISFQATTRGGRLMDNILDQKASIKHGTKSVGSALIGAGAATAAINPYVGIGMLTAGLVAHGVSYAMNPEADIRHWKNLPDEFILIPINLPSGENNLKILAFKKSEFIANYSFTVDINPAVALNICQVVLHDLGAEPLKNRYQELLDYPIAFIQLVLNSGSSAVFTETQVRQATDELYRKHKVKDGIWPKKVLYYIEQNSEKGSYPATERLKAWKSNYTNFNKGMLAKKKGTN